MRRRGTAGAPRGRGMLRVARATGTEEEARLAGALAELDARAQPS
ncbi:hypothetical protein [Streptomyces roseolus]|nr:hypothetical protein [Streptomyces roseolus]